MTIARNGIVSRAVATANEAGRVAPFLLFACTAVALVATGFAAHVVMGDHSSLPGGSDRDAIVRGIAEVEQRLVDLTARVDDIERRGSVAAVRSEESAARQDGPRSVDPSADPNAAAAAETAGNGRGQNGRRDAAFEDFRRLRDAPDDAARLKIARELAASDNPMAQMGALRVLADLAPKEALALVDKWFAESQKTDLPAWQVDRALATLADGKGAGQLGGELKDALRRYYRDGADDVKLSAARALERQGDASSMQQLVASLSADLGNSDVSRRAKSIESLGQTGSKTAAPLLLPLLSDSSDEIRLRAIDALRRTGDATTIEKLLPLLNDPVAAVRDRATRAIEGLRRGDSPWDGRGGGGGFPGGFQFGGGGGGGGGNGRRGGN